MSETNVEIVLSEGYVSAVCTVCNETVASKSISPRILREASEHTHEEEAEEEDAEPKRKRSLFKKK